MLEIDANDVAETISGLFQDGCYRLSDDVIRALGRAEEREESLPARRVLAKLKENAETAARDEVPLCQDTGMAVVFLELGQDAHIVGGDLYGAVQEGTRRAYARGYLRKSVVDRPFSARI
ncbi:MAG: fumarate hydratase, partial [Proteobacteria bacterium]|nr:fumarate hydratase [Pseudomonadota bacterium]